MPKKNPFNQCSFNSLSVGNLTSASHLRLFSNWLLPKSAAQAVISKCGPLSSQAEGSGVFQQLPWQYQQVRTRKRGTEYQPKNIKRKRTHGWIKRLSSKGGIEVLLRRMLKGRKSLSHWRLLSERLSRTNLGVYNANHLNIWSNVDTRWGFGVVFLW